MEQYETWDKSQWKPHNNSGKVVHDLKQQIHQPIYIISASKVFEKDKLYEYLRYTA